MEGDRSREFDVSLARILVGTDCHTDKVEIMKSLIKRPEPLNAEERSFILYAYRSMLQPKRHGLRVLKAIVDQQKARGNTERVQKLQESVTLITNEINTICNEGISLVSQYGLNKAEENPEAQAFYFKMKGDLYRYLCEDASIAERDAYANKANDCYEAATSNVKETNHTASSLSLSIALNKSVFLYEILNKKKEAIETAQHALDESGILVNDGNDDEFAEATMIQQSLRENLGLWTRDEGDA